MNGKLCYNVEVVFNGGSIIERSIELVFEFKNDDLFKDFVSHEELFHGS